MIAAETDAVSHSPGAGWRRWLAAVLLLDAVFLLPGAPWEVDLATLWQAPLELPLVLLLPAILPRSVWIRVRPLLVVVLTFMAVLKLANLAVLEGFGRPFAPLADLALIPTALGTLAQNSIVLAAGAVIAVIVVVAVMAAIIRWMLASIEADTRARLFAACGIAAVIVVLSLVDLGRPLGTLGEAESSLMLRDQWVALRQGVRDTAQFRQDLATPMHPPSRTGATLAGLRGIDVWVIFVESYGRSALTRAPYADIVRPALEQAQSDLAAAGFQSRSAWLTSPTFGGESWLAHSTLMSGLWVTTQSRYAALLRSGRPTLAGDFKRAGWRTVAVMPEITGAWPDGTVFGFDNSYTAPDLGYRGAPFGYVTMPDQYVLSAFARRELARADRPPVMAEIALVSSHIPWAPLPKLVPWSAVGDGSVFTTARTPETADQVWRDPQRIAIFYARSVQYALQTLTSFITTYGSDHTLVIVMGDHQPMAFISGDPLDHDVPVHIIARDAQLLRALDAGRWTAGMTPDASAPVARMDAMRLRILKAFSADSRQADAEPVGVHGH